jgi:hypothetical protein
MNAVVLQRHAQYWLNQLGKTGLLGLLLMVAAGVAWYGLVRVGERDLVTARQRIVAVQQQVANNSRLPVSSSLNQEEQLRLFYKSFGRADSVPDTLQRIYKAAQKQDLMLETGEYTQVASPGERLARYRVGLPVKGTFKQILGFMDRVLQDNPTVALENAAFKRDVVDDATVEAKLVFTVYVDVQP